MLLEIVGATLAVAAGATGYLYRLATERSPPLPSKSPVVDAILHSARTFPEDWIEEKMLTAQGGGEVHKFWYRNFHLGVDVCENGWISQSRVWLEPDDLQVLFQAVQRNHANRLLDRMAER